jgi:hypothetical protein
VGGIGVVVTILAWRFPQFWNSPSPQVSSIQPPSAKDIADELKKIQSATPGSLVSGNKQEKRQSGVQLPYFYLRVTLDNPTALSPLLLSLVNPSRISIPARDALIQSGTGQLYRRLPPPNKDTLYIDKSVPNNTPIPLGSSVAMGNTALPVPFGLTPGEYLFQIRGGPNKITERLQIVYQNAEWIQLIEIYADNKLVFSTPKPPNQPDISLTVVNTGNLALLLDNTSSLLLREPYYEVVLWLLSRPDSSPVVRRDSIKTGWIRPHEHYGPIRLADERVADLGKDGEELYGYAVIKMSGMH